MRHRGGIRQRAPRPVAARRRAARSSLAASGVVPTYELTQGSPAERYWHDQAITAELSEFGGDVWPTEEVELATPDAVFRDGLGCAVYRIGDALALVHLHDGWFRVRVAAPARERVTDVCSAFRQAYPAAYLTLQEDPRVPITFWSMSSFGPQPRLRRVEASPWQPIRGNYAGGVQDELDELMSWERGPERDGQLLVWQGPPGTGKTWALRALASEWSSWAEFHYITDPDAFFVEQASYMIDVLLSDSYAAIDPGDGNVYEEQDVEGKWRVLILEDTGELLSSTAKEKYGQGLSRLLNVVDGMIGQGLRVLALVTTNDELDSLNAASVRPGRCLSRNEGDVGPTVFGSLSAAEAAEWSGDPDATEGTLADLYGRYRAHGKEALTADGGLIEIPGAPGWYLREDDFDAAVAMAKSAKVEDQIAAVAEQVNPLAVDYGQTAWLPDDAKVLWVSGDGTSDDEVEQARAAFLDIDGVDDFDHEAEGMPTGWCDATVLYGSDPFQHGCDPGDESAAMLDALLDVASAPLTLAEPREQPAPPAALAAAERAGESLTDDEVERIFERVVERVLAHPRVSEQPQRRDDGLIRVLERFASRPPDPAPRFYLSMPEREQSITVQAAPAPNVEVTVPEREMHVHVPEQPAPVVQQTIEVPAPTVQVTVERPRPTALMIDYDDEGRKIIVPEEVDE